VTLTDRDRKIVMFIAPAVIIAAYWFLLLAPKREEAAKAGGELTVQQDRRDQAQARVDALDQSRTDFAADYAELVRLGKAVPEEVDMPTLLVQLETAAIGTDIKFTKITAEAREAAAPAAPPPAAPGSGDGTQPAAAGGAPAESAPGSAAEGAGNAVNTANSTSAAQDSGVNPADTQTSTTAREGALPIGGGAATPAGGTATGSAPLDTVPMELEFVGNFYDLAKFFHRIKRYVETSETNVLVRGRLVTIDGMEFVSEPDMFPRITATITASAYLAPQTEGATAGATSDGPAVTPASTGGEAAPTTPGAPPVAAPTATATR
jgi:Tfp pilus assembly protein PilO